jgi:hypothetical protein
MALMTCVMSGWWLDGNRTRGFVGRLIIDSVGVEMGMGPESVAWEVGMFAVDQ